MDPNKKYQIITDSLTLQALKNPNNSNPFVHKIRLKLNQIEDFKVTLVYTKAHAGTKGNELADQLAKEAIKEGLEYKTLISKSFIKNTYIKSVLTNETPNGTWQENSHTRTNGLKMSDSFPSIFL